MSIRLRIALLTALVLAVGIEISWIIVSMKIGNQRHNTIAAGVVATLVGLLLGYMLSKVLTNPLQALLPPMRRMAAGDFNSRIPTELPHEMKEVALAFNDMALAVNRRVRNLEMLNKLASETATARRVSDIAKQVDAAAIMALEARARVWVFNLQSDRLESVPAEGIGGRIIAGAGCAVTLAARESRSVSIGEGEELPPNSSIVTGLDPVSAAVIVPLTTPEGTIGSISFESIVERRRLSPEEISLATAMANTVGPAVATHIRTEDQARYARLLQQVLVPTPSNGPGGLDVAAWYKPAGEMGRMGGDYYDFVQISDDEIWVAIGDVSGKGLPAAEYTAMVKYVLRSYMLEYKSPAKALALTNLALSAQMRPEAFITLFCGLIDCGKRTITYAGAGHPYPLVVSRQGEITELHASGVAAGLFSDAAFDERVQQFFPGDLLLLYTDGMSEARLGNAMYEERRMLEAVRECAQRSARDAADYLANDVQAFAGGKLKDDIAIVVIGID